MTKKMSAFDNTKKDSVSYYVLLNKDIEIAKFHVNENSNIIKIDSVEKELPFWISDLGTFIVNRRAPKHRENMKKLLDISGCNTTKGFLEVTHALSLIDTFWVKSADSQLSWDDVSLYDHPFDEAIAKTAFEGGLHGRNFSSTSPEYGTDGSFAKCWIRENEQIKLLKRGSSGARNAGLEPYSEYYSSQLIKAFTNDFVPYDLRSRNGRICSVCDIFTSEQYGFLPYAAVSVGNSTYNSVIKRYDELIGGGNFARMMFIVDAVILNEDRHTNNFGFLVDNDKQEIVASAPLFDHNIAMLPYAEEDDFENIAEYLEQKGPRLSREWLEPAADCMTPECKKALINLHGFKFERHPKYNWPEWRIEAMEQLINQNIEIILSYL